MARVTIDASAFQLGDGYYSGISRTTRELVQALLSLPLPFQVSLFSQRFRGSGLAHCKFEIPTNHLRLPRLEAVAKLTAATGLIERICGCDLFHAPGNYSPIRHIERSVVTIHDAMFFAFPENHLGATLERKRIPPLARRCSAIITPSEASKRDIVNYLQVDPNKVVVTPWGICHSSFRPQLDKDAVVARIKHRFRSVRPYFLSVSCDIGRKNSRRVLEQYVRFLKQNPVNDLVMVWRNPPMEVREVGSTSRSSGRIILVSQVSDEELRDLYCGATATFFPSLYEGFGLPILESMACGTPVVTSRNSSLQEVGGDAAYYVNPEDDDDILRAFEILEGDVNLCSTLSRKGLEQASKFTWNSCALQTIKVYTKCLSELA